MNRAARQHLLGVLGDNPACIATVPPSPRVARITELFLSALGIRMWFVVPLGSLPALPRGVRVVRGRRS